MFKIISAGWNCERYLLQTLGSVDNQTVQDFEIMIVLDPSNDNGGDLVRSWCESRDDRWRCQINTERQFAVRNQFEGICLLNPQPDDIVVFLDLDGDRLAHVDVFAHLLNYYADDTLVTYGNYRPVPWADTCPPAVPFPPDIVARNAYREHVSSFGGGCCFNHLRTMKGKIFWMIPQDRFHWEDGRWYTIGTDYVFMIPALELAGGRYKCLEEVMLLYNNANPFADYLVNPGEGCVVNSLQRPALQPI